MKYYIVILYYGITVLRYCVRLLSKLTDGYWHSQLVYYMYCNQCTAIHCSSAMYIIIVLFSTDLWGDQTLSAYVSFEFLQFNATKNIELYGAKSDVCY